MHIRDITEYLELIQPYSNQLLKLHKEITLLASKENTKAVRPIFGSKGQLDQTESVCRSKDILYINSQIILKTEINK
jgi:hypothetical protein